MKLLHTGDLHLDSAFCSYGERDAERQREAGREMLRRIFATADVESCDMILIAGDLFDRGFISPESAELFCSLVEKYNIPVVLSPGNHDPYTENGFYAKARARLGEVLTVFSSSELQMFEFDALHLRVFGYAFTSPVLSQSPLSAAQMPEDNGYLKIFCGHADLASPVSRYAPVTLAEISACGFDYAALGHIHNRAEREDRDGRVRYCGFAEGRSFDEIGDGGVWIVELEGSECRCERKILSSETFWKDELDVSSADTEETLGAIVSDKAKTYAKDGAHLRLILTGRAERAAISAVLAQSDEIAKSVGLNYIELIDETLPFIDGEYLERDTTLRGELYRTLLPKLAGDDPEQRRVATQALRIGLAAIDGKNIFDAFGADGGRR
ncbi:MAG: DNA repair exonuclease [Ruminococcaceae bacterium]|nr:DNA repair exonuclease [Oscillospiraceae bacterium]